MTIAQIAERGVRGFSVAEASRRLGVTAAAPYRHFADRDELLAAVVEPLRRARRVVRHGVGGQQRERDRGIAVADDGAGQLVGIDLAPADRLARRRAGEAAGVDARVGELDVVVVPLLLDAEHLLHLGLGLEDEVLRRSAAQHDDGRLEPVVVFEQAEHRLLHVLGPPLADFLPARQRRVQRTGVVDRGPSRLGQAEPVEKLLLDQAVLDRAQHRRARAHRS